MVDDSEFPSRWHYSRWRATSRLASFLYVSGITSNGGSTTFTHEGITYRLPRFRDVLPYRFRRDLPDSCRRPGYMRPYFLWKENWWWQCHKRQGWKVWTHHTPYPPAAFGVCGRCIPCQECGEPDLWCKCFD